MLSVLVLRENEKRKFDLLGGVEFDFLAAVHFRRDGVGLAVGLLGLGLVGLSDAGSSHLNNNYSDDKLHGPFKAGHRCSDSQNKEVCISDRQNREACI